MIDRLEGERVEHNAIYDRQKSWLLDIPLTWDRYYKIMCQPPHQGGTLYGLDHKIFLDFLLKELPAVPDKQYQILDYGCGTGALAIALAQRGFEVTGFDLSDTGIAIAKQAALKAGVHDQSHFLVANAQQLPFEDEQFDLIIGKAVLHHTIKYEHTDRELYRVLKPDGKVFFFEGAASNPLIAFARKFTLKEALGDVPLTVSKIKYFARAFQEVHIKGYFFLYMFKRLGYYSSDETLSDKGRNFFGKTLLFRWLLMVCLAFDKLFINNKISETAGRYLIEFKKI